MCHLGSITRRSNFCKDHRDKIEVRDPLVVEDLISDEFNNRRKLARLVKQFIIPLAYSLAYMNKSPQTSKLAGENKKEANRVSRRGGWVGRFQPKLGKTDNYE